jgi:hypothetical protein
MTRFILLFTVCSLAGASTVWHEGDDGTGDAGNLPSTAEFTIGLGPLTAITGTLGDVASGADMYEIYLTGVGTFTATITGHGANPVTNPAIYLFDANGNGVEADDNTASSLLGSISVTGLNAGNYYILITSAGHVPTDGTSQIFPGLTNSTAEEGPGASVGPIAGYHNTSGGNAASPANTGKGYEIDFSSNVDFSGAPEPATVGITALGLGAIALRFRRKA